MSAHGFDEVVFVSSLTRAVGIVKGEPTKIEAVKSVTIRVSEERTGVVEVGEYKYDLGLLEELAKLWSVWTGFRARLSTFLELSVGYDLKLIWFGDDKPLLGFSLDTNMYAVITPLNGGG